MKVLFLYEYEHIEPLGIMALSAFLKREGHECHFVDLAFERDYVRAVEAIAPGIVAYSITTGRHGFYERVNLELKSHLSFFSIFGGPHATFFPEFVEQEGIDAICRGEGEYPLCELADALDGGESYTDIGNLWVKHEGKLFRNDVRPLVEDLDSLPFVDRELVNKYQHYRKLRRRTMLSGRGCPYNCSYCFNHSYNALYRGKGRPVRKRSVEHVLDELKAVQAAWAPKRFHFVDDTFILNKGWCAEFSERYPKEIALPFIANIRANLATPEIIKGLADAGCIVVVYAIESGNDHLGNKVLNRGISEQQILDTAALCKSHGIRVKTQNMLGIPDETLDTALETVRLNIRCKPDYAWCSIFQPYPMTDMWAYCKEKGYLTQEAFAENYYEKSILNLPNRMQIENLHHLFSLAVAFPVLLPLIKQLIRLPLGKFYFALWNLHRAWCYLFKIKWFDIGELFIRD